jgi:hypothetical protein
MTDSDLTEGDEAAPSARRKSARGLDVLAMRELRSAHEVFQGGDASAAEASFLISSAAVLAMLDLASAVREASGVTPDGGELPVDTPRKERRRRP